MSMFVMLKLTLSLLESQLMLKLQLYATVMVTLMLSQIGTSKLFLASLMAKRTSATRLILLVTEHKINTKKYY